MSLVSIGVLGKKLSQGSPLSVKQTGFLLMCGLREKRGLPTSTPENEASHSPLTRAIISRIQKGSSATVPDLVKLIEKIVNNSAGFTGAISCGDEPPNILKQEHSWLEFIDYPKKLMNQLSASI